MFKKTFFILCFSVFIKNLFGDKKLDPKNFLVWGPGLESNFNVPVRYFFIQLVNTENEKFVKNIK